MSGKAGNALQEARAPVWHGLDPAAVISLLKSDPGGLAPAERVSRRTLHGPNTVDGRRAEPWWEELLESFREPMQLLLIAVAVLSAVFGELTDALAIVGLVLVVAVLETASEVRAGRAIDALKAMAAPQATVLTPEGTLIVPAADVVPGDVVLVEGGDIVPADARILHAHGLRVDESSLTGESQAVGKAVPPVERAAPMAERHSMLYAGAPVLAGEATGVVVATGAGSELGRMGTLVGQTREPPTPLQKSLAELARVVLVAAVAASVLIPVLGLLTGHGWKEMLLTGLTVAFATVPEELPILITVLLAVGGRQLARRGALIRRLRAGETLGAVTVVVTDKTGTLTENRLQLESLHGNRSEVLTVAVHAQATDAPSREPMEARLRAAAEADGIRTRGHELWAHPFDSTRKLLSRAWSTPEGGAWLAVSGAPEAVLDRSTLLPGKRREQEQVLDNLAADGLRVIAFARKALPDPAKGYAGTAETLERDLEFLGLAAFRDPVRAGVPEAVQALAVAGVSTVVVTGDHPATAAAVARRAGLSPEVTSGADFDALPDNLAVRKLGNGSIIARAAPATKHRIVQLLQGRGEVVAVTGDGSNDAPALAAADVGVAMGRRGSDLARESADVVLTDDSYPTVVAAIAKGRNITAQLRRAVAFYLGAKLALVTILAVALGLGLPNPFQPAHIVLLEIFMDLGASLAFVSEPSAPRAMHTRPRNPATRFLDRSLAAEIIAVAVTLTAAVLPVYLLLGDRSEAQARSAAVLAWLAAHALIAWTLRTQPTLSWRQNPAFPLWSAAALATGLALTTTALGNVLHLAPLEKTSLITIGLSTGTAVLAAVVLRALRRTDTPRVPTG